MMKNAGMRNGKAQAQMASGGNVKSGRAKQDSGDAGKGTESDQSAQGKFKGSNPLQSAIGVVQRDQAPGPRPIKR